MESKIKLPRKKFILLEKSEVPLDTIVKVPTAAIPVPKICFLVRCSSNILAERTVMRIGERRQTRIAAIDGLAISMPVY